MYNYDFKNEEVIYENADALVEINDKDYKISVVITDKNILLFNNLNKNNVLNSRGMYMPPDYLLELAIPYKSAKFNYLDGDTYLVYNELKIVFYDIDLSKIIVL